MAIALLNEKLVGMYVKTVIVNQGVPQLWLKISIFHVTLQIIYLRASLVAQLVKNLPAKQETQVKSLGREDLLKKSMATLCSILASRIPWTEKSGWLQSKRSQRVRHEWMTNIDYYVALIYKLKWRKYSEWQMYQLGE